MNAALQDFRRIFRITVTQRDTGSLRFMRWLTGLLVLAFVVFLAVLGMKDKLNVHVVVKFIAGVSGFWIVIVWSMLYVPGSLLLNSAMNARLVPRQRRRLMQMTAVGWLVITCAFTAVLGRVDVFPLVGAYMLGASLAMSGFRPAVLLIFVACGWGFLSRHVLPPALLAAMTSPAGLALLTVLLLLFGAHGLKMMYPAGGDDHIDKRDEQLKRIKRFSQNEGADMTDLGGGLGASVRNVYALMLRRDCGKPNAQAMLMHALGPTAHWAAWLGMLAALLLAGVALRVASVLFSGDAVHALADWYRNFGVSIMSAVLLFNTARFGQQLRRTQGEQSLLRLTPLAGDPALLNRRLGVGLLKATLASWALMTATILLAGQMLGGDRAFVLREFALCCLCGEISLVGLLGDFAHGFGWRPMLALRAALLAALQVAVAVGLDWVLGTTVWPWLIAMALGGAVVLLKRGWQRLQAAPVAFPAGRLA